MTKVLYDALYPAGIPLDIPADALVASYVDHPEVVPPCMTQLAQRFPNHVNVSISAHGHLAQIYDVENGAITVAAVPALLTAARAAGIDPTVYCLDQTWPLVQGACTRAGVRFPHYWNADEHPTATIPAGADGCQWRHAGPYDQSLITDQLAQILDTSGHLPSGGGVPITPPAKDDDMFGLPHIAYDETNPSSALLVYPSGRIVSIQSNDSTSAYKSAGSPVVALGHADYQTLYGSANDSLTN